jgi:beta-galactosidase
MKRKIIISFLFIFYFAILSQSRTVVNFNLDWKFIKGNPGNASAVNFNDSGWENVRLPHDWAIQGPIDPLGDCNTGKLPWKGEGWYRKNFVISPESVGQQVYFLFDGIMAFPKVYINGQLAGQWDYGYNSFYLNVSGFIRYGQSNTIAIYVDTRQHDSRWYPGAGIYRKVQMILTDPVHVDIWGTSVSTPVVDDKHAETSMHFTVNNSGTQDEMIELINQIVSPDGTLVLSDIIPGTIPGNSKHVFERNFSLAQPVRWDIESPRLYKVNTIVKRAGKICDSYTTKFGIRSFEFTAGNGFILNGRRVQFKGVNLHHDNGPLGAKFYRRAMEKKLEIMKQMGCNALRTSHNVCSPEVLDLCDSMGILVYNEAFDKWDNKVDYLPQTDFYEFGERNIRNFVVRDRNHPSVIIWSVGNEMSDVQENLNGGLEKLHQMVEFVRKYDNTRPVTIANDDTNSIKFRHFDYYDIHSWNYGRRYLPAHYSDPSKPVIIAESASTLSTRGFYELLLPVKPTDFTKSLQISSYDLNAPHWAEIPDDDFLWQKEDPFVCGEFVWTGFDYLGEPTPYNSELVEQGIITQEQTAKSSYFGIVDLCGIPKDRYYLYRSHWLPDSLTVHILPHWNWNEKKQKEVPVFVYTNGDCAELFLNGKSLGMKCKQTKSANAVERYRLMWENVAYHPGELKAIAYQNGQIIGASSVKTSGKVAKIIVSPDRKIIRNDGEDLSYILVEAFDKNGNFCPLADNLLHFEVSGPAVIEGVGNGNPLSVEPFIASSVRLFYGKAMLIIRSKENNNTGNIGIKVMSKSLLGDKITIASK